MGILNDNGGGFYMPVAPAGYGNGGGLFGGDGSICWCCCFAETACGAAWAAWAA